jgi:hypothetical protein
MKTYSEPVIYAAPKKHRTHPKDHTPSPHSVALPKPQLSPIFDKPRTLLHRRIYEPTAHEKAERFGVRPSRGLSYHAFYESTTHEKGEWFGVRPSPGVGRTRGMNFLFMSTPAECPGEGIAPKHSPF